MKREVCGAEVRQMVQAERKVFEHDRLVKKYGGRKKVRMGRMWFVRKGIIGEGKGRVHARNGVFWREEWRA